VRAAANPVARLERTAHRKRQAAEDVAESLLQRETEDRGEDRRGSQDRKRLHAEVGVQHHHHDHEPQHEHQQVLGDGREVDLAAARHRVDELEHEADDAKQEKYEGRDCDLLAHELVGDEARSGVD
jgi:hypothetical protein